MSGTAAIEKCHAMIRSDHVSEDTNLHEENRSRGTKISKNPTSLLVFHIIFQLIPIKQKEYSCTMVPIDGNTSLKWFLVTGKGERAKNRKQFLVTTY